MSLTLVRIKPYWAEIYDKITLVGICGRSTGMGWYVMEIKDGDNPDAKTLSLPKNCQATGFTSIQKAFNAFVELKNKRKSKFA